MALIEFPPSPASPPLDGPVLVLRGGGGVIDPLSHTDALLDVVVFDGHIVGVGPDGGAAHPDAVVVECAGLVVAPGFIDIHVHVMTGLGDFCIEADDVGVDMKVPIVVDGGTSGVATFDISRRAIIGHPATRTHVLAFMDPNQLYLATKDFICHELLIANDLKNLDVASLQDSLQRNADAVVGLKARACHHPRVPRWWRDARCCRQGDPRVPRCGRMRRGARRRTLRDGLPLPRGPTPVRAGLPAGHDLDRPQRVQHRRPGLLARGEHDEDALVLAEDLPVVCNQDPPELVLEPGFEISVRTDRVSIEYRCWLSQLVTAASEGASALRAVVIQPSDVLVTVARPDRNVAPV